MELAQADAQDGTVRTDYAPDALDAPAYELPAESRPELEAGSSGPSTE